MVADKLDGLVAASGLADDLVALLLEDLRRSSRTIASSSAMTTRTAKVGRSFSSGADLGQVTSSRSRSASWAR